LAAGERAILLRTVGSLDEGPVAYLEIWFPLDIGSQLQIADLDGHMPVVRLVEKFADVRITRAAQTIEPDHAGEEAAKHLLVDPNAPILHVKRVYFAGDRPIELANVRYHPDRYRYAIEFKG
jgi:GntR family transcriptional regulator